MRIAIEIPDARLREALAALLRNAGHEVAPPGAAVDLRILTERRAAATGPEPLLFLRPPPGVVPDPDPTGALSRALSGGPPAVWSAPLDPERLLGALGKPSADGGGPRATSAAPPTAATLDPWLLVRTDDGTLLSANDAAHRCLGAAGLRAGAPIAPVLGSLAEDVLARAEGRKRCDVGDGPRLAVWWSEGPGRRVLGLLGLPEVVGGVSEGEVRALVDLGRASATLAHELRNPLAGLVGAVDVLSEDLPPQERSQVAVLARQRLRAMRALLDDTLRFARAIPGAPGPIDAGAVLRGAVTAARAEPSFAGVTLRVEGEPGVVSALGHEEALHQAVMNLLLNASQAMQGRGTIVASVTREGAKAVLRVRDDGPGIPAEHHERAFTPFWTTKTSGTGLGLAFVRRVAEAAGGRASIEPVARGACVRIELPSS